MELKGKPATSISTFTIHMKLTDDKFAFKISKE